MNRLSKKSFLRIAILALLFTGLGTLVLWDYFRVNRDFLELKALLSNVRYEAITNNKMLIARFGGKDVVVTDKNTKIAKRLSMPTLNKVNYNTTLGDSMIVFYWSGTSDYNKRIHGGDIRLKSWFGFQKNIAVNCTGLVTEGLYPGE